ncbi:MAG: hypothetical protein A2341_12945 [Deltaproteobacteria bacterium RIFOXYB12_FULL_58_9]|nr:MAG: hypothetical protein A2341_12945 [Deltaproteobacteria bacterium RIFOXYB12_FULL_58_9]
MRWTRALIGWIAGFVILLIRITCRCRAHDDPRPNLRRAGRPYIYALLHAHQVSAVVANDDAHMTAMVSRSADGDLLVPALKMHRVTAVRGSSRKGGKDKGGRTALARQAELLLEGVPALLAVDGPRGPRNTVHRGVIDLAQQTNTPVLPVVVIPSRRWILSKTWDRFQIPKPFASVRLQFGPPLEPSAFDSLEAFTDRIGSELAALERQYDPTEAPSVHKR